MRDFINDSLYNSSYGYFSKNVNIFNSSHEMIPFNKLRDQDDYHRTILEIYEEATNNFTGEAINNFIANNSTDFNTDKIKMSTGKTSTNSGFTQMWHTPSELFKPFYGRAVTNFLTCNNKSRTEPLVIYEIGPGNGTMAENILDCLKAEHPQIYENVEYNLIEISEKLRLKQVSKLERKHGTHVKSPKLEILNLPTKFREDRKCWVLGMEVLDNLAHDLIKFRSEDGAVMEAIIHTNDAAMYGSVPGRYWRPPGMGC